jgi:hypothetical protein
MAVSTTILGQGYLGLPSGTTAERPTSPSNGYTWWNTSLGVVESYHGATNGWVALSNVFQATGGTVTTSGSYTIHTFTSSADFQVQSGSKSVDYLIVAGGGGGATDGDVGGGGGAGGMVTGTLSASVGTYGVVVGAAGAGGTNAYTPGTGGGGNGLQGGTSSVFGVSTVGGGGGGTRNTFGLSGGSGGGAGDSGGSRLPGGAGTSGQGNPGGTGWTFGSGVTNGGWDVGGGGGKGSAAADHLAGAGEANSYSGTSVTYAAGGRGTGNYSPTPPLPPSNSGNGGSGGNTTAECTAAAGIVIIRYLT